MKIVTVASLFTILFLQADFGFAQSASIAKTPFPARRDADNRYALTGTLVTPTQVIVEGTVFIVGDKIEAIGKSISVPTGVKNIQISGFIYPGLIDLHDHITWNFLPRWRAEEKFNNRYEWQARDAYLPALSAPHNGIVPPPPRSEEQENLACDANQYGEVKAIVGGATSIVDALGVDDCIKGLARNLDSYSGLYPRGSPEQLWNKVFPLEILHDDVGKLNSALADGHHALIVHLAEGKQKDAASAREFKMFKARGFLHDGVSIIHGVSLNAHDFKEMADNHVGLIWSPRSNIELYGETTDVRAAKAAGVEIALTPDWSPTGSDGVLEELNYAATWDAGHNPRIFTDTELVKMVTAYPAELAKLNDKIGTLEQHHFADLLIIQSEKTDAFHALVTANPTDVRLVVIGGDPVYGDEDLMRGLQPEGEFQPVQFCRTTKFLNLQSEKLLQSKPPKPWKDTVAVLRKALQASGLSLGELAPCEDTPCQ